MISNVANGYRLAWARRWQLLPVLLVVLVPLLLVLLVLDVVAAGQDASIIDGAIAFTGGGQVLGLVLAVVCWLLALTAGVAVAGGAATGALRALSIAARKLPYLLLGLIVAGGLAIGVVVLGAGVAGGLGQFLGLLVFFATLLGVALLGAWLLLTVATAVFGGSAWELSRGRFARTAGAILVGAFAVPFLVAAAVNALEIRIVSEVVNAVLLVAVVAAQAGIVAHVHAAARSEDALPETPLEPGRPRPLLGLALLLPALVMVVVVYANPYRLTAVRTNGEGPPGGAVMAVWPDGRHPILVGEGGGVRYCHDDLCDRYASSHGGTPVMRGFGTAGVGPDGTVVKAALTGGVDNGGPFIQFGRCNERQGCQGEAWIPTRASSDEPFSWSEMAVSSAPDGAALFALAVPMADARRPLEVAPKELELKLIRCPDAKCAKPQRFSIGKVSGTLEHSRLGGWRARLEVAPDGRPTASFWIGHTIQTFTCEPVTCANPRITATDAGPQQAPWVRVDETVVWLWLGGVHTSDNRRTQLVMSDFTERSAALAVSGDDLYVAMAVRLPAPDGLRLTFGGRQPERWQYVVWHCTDLSCRDHRRIPLDVVEGPPAPVRLAAADGRVLLVREDRTMLIPAAAPR